MDFLSSFQLSLIEICYVIFIVFIASIIRGFNGFGFSAICISGFSFKLENNEFNLFNLFSYNHFINIKSRF